MEYNYPKFTPEMKKTHTILIPNMAITQFRLLEYALRYDGYKCEILGNCGSAVAQLGLKYVHNDTCYPALLVIGQFLDALNSGKYDRGVIVAESFDYEIIDKAYQPYDNLSLLVCLKSTGDIEKKVIASVTESLKADYSFGADWARLVEIFQAPSLQMISFTITEKGYSVAPADLERGLTPVLAMGKVTALLYERFKAGALPLTVQSMDNCSHNGDKVKAAVFAYASKWDEQGLVPAEILANVKDDTKITYP